MSYELLQEDEQSYKLKHPEGHEVTIAKQHLSDVLHQKIRGYAKGGFVDEALDNINAEPGTFGEPEKKESSSGFFSDVGRGLKQARDQIVTSLPESPNLYDDKFDVSRSLMGGMGASPMQSPAAEAPQTGLIASNGPLPASAFQNVQPSVPVGGEAVPQAQPGAPAGAGAIAPGMEQFPATSGVMKEMGAINAMGERAIRGSEQATKSYTNQLQSIEQQRQLEAEQDYSRFAASMGRKERELDQLGNAYANHKIDPNRVWNNASTPQKVSASIAMILGGMGAGLTGGPNQAVAMINRIIDQDIDAQKSDRDKLGSLYNMNLKRMGDEKSAYSATKLQQMAVYESQLKQAAAKYQGTQAGNSAMMSLAALKQQQLPLMTQLAQKEQGDYNLKRAMSGDLNAIQKLPEDQRKRFVPGFGLARSEKDAEEAGKIVTAAKQATDSIKSLLQMADSGRSWSPDDRAKADVYATMLQAALRTTVAGPGAVSEYEYTLLKKVAANPLELTRLSGPAKTSLQTVMGKVNRNMNIQLGQYGLRPANMPEFAPAVPQGKK
jgi:hypothetical protein